MNEDLSFLSSYGLTEKDTTAIIDKIWNVVYDRDGRNLWKKTFDKFEREGTYKICQYASLMSPWWYRILTSKYSLYLVEIIVVLLGLMFVGTINSDVIFLKFSSFEWIGTIMSIGALVAFICLSYSENKWKVPIIWLLFQILLCNTIFLIVEDIYYDEVLKLLFAIFKYCAPMLILVPFLYFNKEKYVGKMDRS